MKKSLQPAIFSIVGVIGLEPTAYWSQTSRSSQLSYTPERTKQKFTFACERSGCSSRVPTHRDEFLHPQIYVIDLCRGPGSDWRHKALQASALPLSYLGFYLSQYTWLTPPCGRGSICGPDRTRTRYLLGANEALYQVSYRPLVFKCEKIIAMAPSYVNRPLHTSHRAHLQNQSTLCL